MNHQNHCRAYAALIFFGLTASCSNPDPASLYPVEIAGQWGFIDSMGNVRVKPQFDEVREFRNGLAWVKMSDGWTLINRSGQPVLPSRFDSIFVIRHHAGVTLTIDEEKSVFRSVYRMSYTDGDTCSYKVRQGDLWGLVDYFGRLLIPSKFDDVGPWSDGRAWFHAGDKFGFLDSGGVARIPAQFVSVTDFGSGRAWARTEDGFGLINHDGAWVLPPKKKRASVSMFLGGHCLVEEEEMVPGPLWSPMERREVYWSKLDKSGKRMPFFPPDIDKLAFGWSFHTSYRADIGPAGGVMHTASTHFYGPNSNHLSLPEVYYGFRKLSDHLVYVGHYYNWQKWGVMRVYPDSIGAPVWNEFENEVYPSSDGIVRVMKREWIHVTRDDDGYAPPLEILHWGAMDSLGRWIVQPAFDATLIYPFENGRAIFVRQAKFGVIDSLFAERLKPDFDSLARVGEGRWAFCHGGRWGLMDNDFHILSEARWTSIHHFVGALARFGGERGWGYVNRDGRVVWVSRP